MNDFYLEVEYFLSNNIINLKPWEIVSGERMMLNKQGLQKRFPNTNLFPFAVRTDCDDVACLNLNASGEVVVIHDYSSVGWERREVFDSFWGWFQRVVDDMVEFAKADVEYEREKRR